MSYIIKNNEIVEKKQSARHQDFSYHNRCRNQGIERGCTGEFTWPVGVEVPAYCSSCRGKMIARAKREQKRNMIGKRISLDQYRKAFLVGVQGI